MRCRLYVDEVGNGDLNAAAADDNARYLTLCGVVTTVAYHDTRFQPELDHLKADMFGHTPARPVILHRRDVMKRQGPFAVLHDAARRSEFDQRLFALLETLPYQVITVVIDKRLHLQQYNVWRFDPYHYCMHCLLERYVRWLDDHGPDFVGDVVAEARNKNPDKKLKASFARAYSRGTDQVNAGVFQARITSSELKLSPKSENLAGLQIADALAHPLYRAMRQDRDGVQRPQDFGSRIASMVEARKYRRSPYNRANIDGYGRKWLP